MYIEWKQCVLVYVSISADLGQKKNNNLRNVMLIVLILLAVLILILLLWKCDLIGKEERGLLASIKKKYVHGHKHIKKHRIFYDIQLIFEKDRCKCFYSYWTVSSLTSQGFSVVDYLTFISCSNHGQNIFCCASRPLSMFCGTGAHL